MKFSRTVVGVDTAKRVFQLYWAGIPQMEPSQPVECGWKPRDVQFAFE